MHYKRSLLFSGNLWCLLNENCSVYISMNWWISLLLPPIPMTCGQSPPSSSSTSSSITGLGFSFLCILDFQGFFTWYLAHHQNATNKQSLGTCPHLMTPFHYLHSPRYMLSTLTRLLISPPRSTKIVASIGAATSSDAQMAKLVKCGISVAHFNLTFHTEVRRDGCKGGRLLNKFYTCVKHGYLSGECILNCYYVQWR